MDSKVIHDMFFLGLPIAEKIIRPVIVYAFLIVGLRLAGKRELAQLNPFDLVVLLTISNTVQNAIIGDDNSVTGGVVGAATLLFVNYCVVRFLYGHERLERLIEGELDEIERAALEPGGTICFFRRVPSPDTARHDELMAMLHKISTQLVEQQPL